MLEPEHRQKVTAQSAEDRTVNLGGGRVVPYPQPLNEVASKIGRANRRSDTKPEVRLRSALHRRGQRFRKDMLIRAGGLRVHPDIVFTRRQVAVFVDGCFWHRCPHHQSIPKTNRNYWLPKLAANVERDRKVDAALVEHGWTIVRIWEHDEVEKAVALIEEVLGQPRDRPGRRTLGAS